MSVFGTTVDATYPFGRTNGKIDPIHTWFGHRDQICDILHEDATLQLQLRLATLVDELLVRELVLGFRKIDVFATEEDSLEEIDVILQEHGG